MLQTWGPETGLDRMLLGVDQYALAGLHVESRGGHIMMLLGSQHGWALDSS